MQEKQIIYFLCTGNSCRSQMAEGFAKQYLGDSFEVLSAGIEPKGLNPWAIEVMKEKGIDISSQTSDIVSTKLVNQADYVITLCKDAKERCPVILPRSRHYHWSFDDPALIQGNDEEIREAFRSVRDEIEETIQKFINGDAGVAIDFKNNDIHYKQKKDFGETIKLIREQKGWSLEEFANKMQISEDYLSKTEKNLTEPSKFFIHRLAAVSMIPYENLISTLYNEK